MSDMISREITEEMVKEYCQKRDLVLITRELFEEMKTRWSSAEKHGRWVMQGTAYGCSLCGEGVIHPFHNYCPNCGARMAEGEEG